MGNPDKIVAVGLGEVLYDHDVVTDEYTFGGAPANFADHFLKCSRLISGPDAAEVHVVSAVGDDERGRAVSAELEARGLCDGLCRVGELPTGVVDKRRDAAGVNAYEILPGAWDAMTWSDALARLAARTDVVCFGSLAQRSAASHATVVRFLDGVIRRERPTLRVFDVNGVHFTGEMVLVDDAHRIVFSGDIMVNIKGFSKEQYDFNLLAPYLMTTVNLDSRRAAAERKYLQSLFPTDVYTYCCGHGAIMDPNA